MLIQLRKVEELLRKTVTFATLADSLIQDLFQTLILCGDRCQLITQIRYAVMVVSLVGVPDVLTLVASEDYRRAINLMLEDVCVGKDLFASPITIATLEFYLR